MTKENNISPLMLENPAFTELSAPLGGNDRIISRIISPDEKVVILATWHTDYDSGDWMDDLGSFDDVPLDGAILHDTTTGNQNIDSFRFFTPRQKDPADAQADYARACKYASGEIITCELRVEVYACDVLLGESCIGNIESDAPDALILATINDILDEAIDEAENKLTELTNLYPKE